MMGLPLIKFIQEMKNLPVITIRANCEEGSSEMINIIKEFR